MHDQFPVAFLTEDGSARTTSLVIAEGADTQHKNVLQLVRTYLDDLQEFGQVGFRTERFATTGGNQRREVASLNEQQTQFLLSRMRNVTPSTYKKLGIAQVKVPVFRRETEFFNLLSDFAPELQVIRQYGCMGYNIDGFIPSLNIAIEYDEHRHKYITEKDAARESAITKFLDCTFVRVQQGREGVALRLICNRMNKAGV